MTEDVRNAATPQEPAESRDAAEGVKLPWEPPNIEDVSEEVMAQPYIRFT